MGSFFSPCRDDNVRAFHVHIIPFALFGGLFLEYKSFMLYGGYRLGLLDLDKMDNMTTKARGFFVGIGIN